MFGFLSGVLDVSRLITPFGEETDPRIISLMGESPLESEFWPFIPRERPCMSRLPDASIAISSNASDCAAFRFPRT